MLESLNTDLLLFIVVQLIAGAAVYGGVRADLKNMHQRQNRQDERQDRQEAATKGVHSRIDQLFQAHWSRNHPTN